MTTQRRFLAASYVILLLCDSAQIALAQPAETGDAERFARKQENYGDHLVWVYGDYTDEVHRLCDCPTSGDSCPRL